MCYIVARIEKVRISIQLEEVILRRRVVRRVRFVKMDVKEEVLGLVPIEPGQDILCLFYSCIRILRLLAFGYVNGLSLLLVKLVKATPDQLVPIIVVIHESACVIAVVLEFRNHHGRAVVNEGITRPPLQGDAMPGRVKRSVKGSETRGKSKEQQ